MQSWYKLKRKNNADEVTLPIKRLRPSIDLSAMFDDPDIKAKLQTKNRMLFEEIKLLDKQLKRPPSPFRSQDTAEWYQALMKEKQEAHDRISKEYRMRVEFTTIVNEYVENEKLWEESDGLPQVLYPKSASIFHSSMSPGHLRVNVLALGVIQLHSMLERQRTEMFSRAAKLEQDMKNMGWSLV